MELLYIWVDGYRNFQKIGFNLSDRFEIDFNIIERKLTVESIAKNHNIFGNNVLNISAIIGKNATGKSNLLELISTILKSKKSTLIFDFIAVLKSDFDTQNQIYIYTNKDSEFEFDKSFNTIQDSSELNNLNVAYFSNIQDDRELNISRSVINLTPSKSVIKRKSDMLNQFKFLLSENYLNLDLESPKTLIISTITKPSYSKHNRDISNLDSSILDDIKLKFKNALKTPNPIKHFSYSFIFSFFSYVLLEAINETRNKKRELFEVNPDFNNLQNLFSNSFKDISEFGIKELVQSIKEFIELTFYEFTQVGSLNKKDAMSLMDFDRAIGYLNPQLIKEGKYNQSRAYYLVDLNIEHKRILKEFLTIFNHNRIIEVSWGGISSGHKAFLNVFSQFYSVIKKVNNKANILICIDEGDLYMHPIWQKEFLSRLLNYLKSTFKANMQIILTSHSPFLVSDLPRRNIIYLDRTEDYFCSVIPYADSKDETFGANLLDLYASSFFLKGGTISKFAYDIIKDVVSLLKSQNIDKQDFEMISYIISIVGDDVIKFKLVKMLEDAKNRN
ncbi:MAG: hypothetical protein SCALA702_01700 [Melioribacteraceae bacterium]|nr:MAG: hypothetical protein SCALA702_01700 [Melioribacteraceae bacterium]